MKRAITFIELDETVSTNTFLATYQAAEPGAITVATAEFQSAGRGQTGNSWESEKGKNLLFSILVEPESFPATHAFLLSEAIALSIRDVIADALNPASLTPPSREGALASIGEIKKELSVTVKWPNDIYVGDCKIAGILIENTLCGQHIGRSIIGCGVDINQQAFRFPFLNPQLSTPSQAPTPVSLRQLLGHDSDRTDILHRIIEAFRHRYTSILSPLTGTQPLHSSYLAALYRRTGLHPYRDANGTFLARIHDVEPSGHLILCDESGHFRRYAFKEVEYIYTRSEE